MLHDLKIGEAEQLGEIVLTKLGQAVRVGLHPTEGPEIYFASNGSPAKLIVLDLFSGLIKREFNLNIADAIWAMTISEDGCVYLAGTSGGLLFRYDPIRATLETLGEFPSDPWVWELSASKDGKVYGATYPEAKVFQYDTQTNQYEDLGRADHHSAYARTIFANESHLYVGLGSTVKVVQYDKATAHWQEIILEGYSGKQGFAERVNVIDNHLFVYIQKKETVVYDLQANELVAVLATSGAVEQGEAEQQDNIYFCNENGLYRWNRVSNSQELVAPFELEPVTVLGGIKSLTWISRPQEDNRHGKLLTILTAHGYCFIYDEVEGQITEYKQNIPSMSINIHALAVDDHYLYAGGYHRALSIWDIEKEQLVINYPHFLQVEGMLLSDGDLYLGIYTQALVYRYFPLNPLLVDMVEEKQLPKPELLFKIGHGQDRPFALAEGDGYVFFGSIADYGILDGAVTIYNKATKSYKVLQGIIPNQSIVGLAYKDGLLYGSSSVWGGLGIEPVEKEAQMFIYDVKNDKLLELFTPSIPELDIPAKMIGELSIGPDGLLWGIVEGTIFAYETTTMSLVKACRYYESSYQHSKWRPCFIRWGSDGLLYTTLDRRLVIIDPKTLEHRTVEDRPQGLIAVGPDGHIYFGDGPMLLRRKIVR